MSEDVIMSRILMVEITLILFIYLIKLFQVTMFGANILLFGIPAMINTNNEVIPKVSIPKMKQGAKTYTNEQITNGNYYL